MSARRMVTMILLNVVVSAVVVLAILYWWDSRENAAVVQGVESVPIVLPTNAPAVTAVADAPLAPTETPVPSNQPLVHIVAAGDTLSNISRTYDVSMEDIIAANNLLNPNALDIGQEIFIPVGGLAEPTPIPPTPTTAVSELPAPIATEPPQSGEVNVVIGEVVGVGQLTAEAVQIINRGSGEVTLTGWELSDDSGQRYTFGTVKIFGGGAGILLHTEAGADGSSDFYWGLENAVWQSGKTVTLRDASGTVQSTLVIP